MSKWLLRLEIHVETVREVRFVALDIPTNTVQKESVMDDDFRWRV